MDDMDAESEELGGKRKFFTGDYARDGWAITGTANTSLITLPVRFDIAETPLLPSARQTST
jgi:hypothetical protein